MGSRELKQYSELDEETLALLKFAIAGCPGLRRPRLRPGPGRARHPAPATVFLWASLRPNPAPKGKPSGLPCRFKRECSGRTGLHFLTELCPRPARTWLPWTRRSCCEHLCDLCDLLWQSPAFPIAFPGSRFNVTTCQRDSRHSLTRWGSQTRLREPDTKGKASQTPQRRHVRKQGFGQGVSGVEALT
jgi:hypothetical protein